VSNGIVEGASATCSEGFRERKRSLKASLSARENIKFDIQPKKFSVLAVFYIEHRFASWHVAIFSSLISNDRFYLMAPVHAE